MRQFDGGATVTREGSFTVAVNGRCRGVVFTDGASVRLGGRVIASGRGVLRFDATAVEDDFLAIVADRKDGLTTLTLDAFAFDRVEPGWTEGESFVQLDAKDRNAVSPEVQAMLERMQRNMLYREERLRAEFQAQFNRASD